MSSKFLKTLMCVFALQIAFPVYAHSPSESCSKTFRVAIIDTGLNLQDPRFKGHICPSGHKNFVPDGLAGPDVLDVDSHGTHVAGLIQKYAGAGDYCFVIYRYYSDILPGSVNAKNEIEALKEAVLNHVNIVNYSGGGPEFSEDEYIAIRSHPEITFVVAAGNENENIEEYGKEYYPASYFLGNEVVVGALDKNGEKLAGTNWSKKIIAKELGQNVLSYSPFSLELVAKSGTSMATAIHTGKVVAKHLDMCHAR